MTPKPTSSNTPAHFSLRMLGTGGPWVNPERFGPSNLITVGDDRLLFDTGRGVNIRLVQAGEDPGKITAVFLTHHHLDHISDLGDVMITSWLRGRTEELVIYGPVGTKDIVSALLTSVYAKDIEWRSDGEPAWGGWKPVRAVDLAPGDVVETDNWRVSCETVVHGHGLDFSPEFLESWQCFGYRIEVGDKVIAISGDTVDCEGVRKLARNADLLVQCCFASGAEVAGNAHLETVGKLTLATAPMAATIATASNVSHMAVTHLRPKGEDRLKEIRDEIGAIYDGKLTIGEDLCLIPVA